jgi:hypothetical protein
MIFPGINQSNYDPKASWCENNKLAVTFLVVGGVLTALGVVLLCCATGQAMSTVGGIVTSLGLPLVSYAIFALIYNRCVNGGPICPKSHKKKKKDEAFQRLEPRIPTSSDRARIEETRAKRVAHFNRAENAQTPN